MDPMQPVELRGAMVTIRPLGVDDAEGILAAADSDEVFAWLPYPRPLDLAAARAWITDAIADRRALRRHPLAVIDSQSGSVIGSTSYWDFDSSRGQVEIGSTWFSRACWRTGANTETKLLMLGHAFERLSLERVAFRTDIRNERSQRAIERLGAVREGVHRHEMRRRDGSWRDSVHYSILRSEWPAAKQRLMSRLRAAGRQPPPR